jgi:hypothetical protein
MVNDPEKRESILVIVIEQDNLERMREADPITLETKLSGGVLPVPEYPDRLRILIAYEEDDVKLWQLARSNNLGDLLHYLARGWKFKRGLDGTEHSFKLNTK